METICVLRPIFNYIFLVGLQALKNANKRQSFKNPFWNRENYYFLIFFAANASCEIKSPKMFLGLNVLEQNFIYFFVKHNFRRKRFFKILK